MDGPGDNVREGTVEARSAGTTEARSAGTTEARSPEELDGRVGGGGGVIRRKLGRAGGGGRVGAGTLAGNTDALCPVGAAAGVLGFDVEGGGGVITERDHATCAGGGGALDRNGAGFGLGAVLVFAAAC